MSSATQRGLQTVRYAFDPAVSRFTVQAFATGLLSSFGHNPTIAIRDFDGAVEFAPGAYETASVHMNINLTTLELLDEMKRSDREKLEEEMFDKVLAVSRFPQTVFQSKHIGVQSKNENLLIVMVDGDLTLHEVTHSLSFSARVIDSDPSLRMSGDFSLRQSDYGIKPVSLAGGVLRLKDELKFKFEIVAKRDG